MRKQQQTSLMMLALYAILICAMLILAVAGARLYTADRAVPSFGPGPREWRSACTSRAAIMKPAFICIRAAFAPNIPGVTLTLPRRMQGSFASCNRLRQRGSRKI